MSASNSGMKCLLDVLGSDGFISDGDWIESKDQDPTGDVRLIQLADLGVARYLNRSNRFMTKQKAVQLGCTFLQKGDILIARMPDPIGRACIFPGDSKASVTVVDVCIVRPDPTIVDSAWLTWMINSPAFGREIEKHIKGTTRLRISRTNLEKVPFVLPPLPEQKRIAAILDAAEALREKRRQAIALLEKLPQSLFDSIFGASEAILQNWPIAALSGLLTFLTSGSRGWAEYYSDHGDPFLRIQNVRRNLLELDDIAYVQAPDTAEAKRTRVQPGDVLLSITADLGRTAVIPDDLPKAFISQHLAILRTAGINPHFLSAYLTSPAGQKLILGRNRQAVKAGLNFDDIRSIIVPLPPVEVQEKYASSLRSINQQLARYRSLLSSQDSLFASLQHRAFRGEL